MFSVPLYPGENRGERLEEFESVSGFHLFENSHKLCRGFHQAMKERRTCVISFTELLFPS